MDETSQDHVPPRLKAQAVAFHELAADIDIAAEIARSRGTSVRPANIHPLADGGLSITTNDGATMLVDPTTVATRHAEWSTGDKLVSAIKFVRAQEAGRRSIRLARKMGRNHALVACFYRDAAGMQRTGSTPVTLAPRRATGGRGLGRAARQATNHRSSGSRRTAASSSTAGTDPGDPDPALPGPFLRLALSRAVPAFRPLGAGPDQALGDLRPRRSDLILRDYVAQREHSREIEKRTIEYDCVRFQTIAKYQVLRLVVAGLVAALVVVVCGALIILDKPTEGFVLLVSEIAALVGAFLGERRSREPTRQRERAARDDRATSHNVPL